MEVKLKLKHREIKIVRFPYKEYKVGDVVDLGFEKNASLVSLQRAVWMLSEKEQKRLTKLDEIDEKREDLEVVQEVDSKSVLKNELREKIQEKETKNSFWDNLK